MAQNVLWLILIWVVGGWLITIAYGVWVFVNPVIRFVFKEMDKEADEYIHHDFDEIYRDILLNAHESPFFGFGPWLNKFPVLWATMWLPMLYMFGSIIRPVFKSYTDTKIKEKEEASE